MRKLSAICILSFFAIILLIAVGSAFQEDELEVASTLYESQILDSQDEDDGINESESDITSGLYSIANISTSTSTNSSPSSYNERTTDDTANLIVKYTSRKIDLMSEADSLSYIIATIPKGTPIHLYEDCDCKWICVAYNNHYGYVRSDDLIRKGNEVGLKNDLGFSSDQKRINPQGHTPDNSFYNDTNDDDKDGDSSTPKGATALCNDGTYSFSRHRRGTCSWHGGVRKWLK